MKTKDLIKALQEIDPSGEIECCVGNIDIHFVSLEPAFYDGPLQVLTRDSNEKRYYNIIGGKYVRSGNKIQIHTLSIGDAIGNNTKTVIDYSDLGNEELAKRYKEADEKTVQLNNKIHIDLERDLFVRWARTRGAEIAGDLEEIDSDAAWFFSKNMSPDDPMTWEKTEDEKSGKCFKSSYNDRRWLQWDLEIKIEFNGMDWIFTKNFK